MYPGGAVGWEVLWLQNVLLLFVQFTTAASLYSQDTRYSELPLYPWNRLKDVDRRLVLSVHAFTGVAIVAVNLGFMVEWTTSYPSVVAAYSADPTMAVSAAALTAALVLMAFFGVSLYANVRPETRFPLWRFRYGFSRKLHRGLFVFVVAVLGHHVFLVERVVVTWIGWLLGMEVFGVLMMASVAVWGMLAGHAVLMVAELLSGDMFSGWSRSFDREAAAAGAVFAVLWTAAVAFTGLTPLAGALAASILLTSSILVHRMGWRPVGFSS